MYTNMNTLSSSTSHFTRKKIIVLLLVISLAVFIFWNSKESSTTVANVVLPKSKTTPAPIKFGPKPYFMKDGTVYPEPAVFNEEFGRRDAILLPEEDPDAYDRFENQLMFVPPNYHETRNLTKNKTIVVYSGYAGWWGIEGPHMSTWFTDHKCPVNTCKFSMNKSDAETADLVLFGAQYDAIKIKRTPNQIYAFYRMESPIHYSTKFPPSLIYNWTLTYRHDSTIPIPYSKWAYYDPAIRQMPQTRNFAENRTKKVAWMVSNCEAHNDRDAYVKELQKYIEVDVYGKCGTLECGSDTDKCLRQFAKDYKFYLAFENSHCKDYITEKVFRNSLGRGGIVPVVLGARKEEYEQQLPYKSFIYVEDFASPEELAEYLHKVDQDDDLYNSYFQWVGTGEIHTLYPNLFYYAWCRVCAMLHDDYTMSNPRWYPDINKWWFDPDTVRRGFWRDTGK